MRGIVYQAKNKINGKIYIGVTGKALCWRKACHIYAAIHHKGKSIFHKAIRKYGRDAFEWSILHSTDNEKELFFMEKILADELGAMHPDGYNLMAGNGHISISDEYRIKRRNMNLGRRHSLEARRAMSESARLRKRPVIRLNDMSVFPSGKAAADAMRIDKRVVTSVCRARQNHVQGYKFIYLDDFEFWYNDWLSRDMVIGHTRRGTRRKLLW